MVRTEDGEDLVKGAMLVPWPMKEGQTVRGTWEARYVGPRTATQPSGDPNQIGPQVGQGSLTAEREDDELRINLNPQMADNNVLLIAAIEDGSLRGRWEYSTFAGVRGGGTFDAQPAP
jgi:hypothetical protein